MVGRQPYAPADFTPEEIPGTHFQGLSRPQGIWFRRKEPRKKTPVTPPGIDPGTVLVAQCLNHYDTPGPLLGNSVLKFDLSGVERRNKHDIFQSRYQLGEFHHLYDELRKDYTKFFEYCRMSPSTYDYIVQAIRQHISHISTNFQ